MKTPFCEVAPLVLPSTGTSVNIVHYDAADLVVQLLTDVCFDDSCWMHHKGQGDHPDPLAPPPDTL